MLFRPVLIALLVGLPLFTSACADTSSKYDFNHELSTPGIEDPLEPLNRVSFTITHFLDGFLMRPITRLYVFFTPKFIQDRVSNILSNMNEPVFFANNLMQGELDKAGTSFQRFALNTVVGFGGMFDIADEMDITQERADFGQTLASWGIDSGPFLYIPLLGPSTVRDGIGIGADAFMSPWSYITGYGGSSAQDKFLITSISANTLTNRAAVLDEYEALEKGSLDFYATLRSVFIQHRNMQLGIISPTTNFTYDNY